MSVFTKPAHKAPGRKAEPKDPKGDLPGKADTFAKKEPVGAFARSAPNKDPGVKMNGPPPPGPDDAAPKAPPKAKPMMPPATAPQAGPPGAPPALPPMGPGGPPPAGPAMPGQGPTPFAKKMPQAVGNDGQSDKIPANVPNGAFVMPAHVVSAIGRGSSDAGHAALSGMFPPADQGRMANGGMKATVGPVRAPHFGGASAPLPGGPTHGMPHMADGGSAMGAQGAQGVFSRPGGPAMSSSGAAPLNTGIDQSAAVAGLPSQSDAGSASGGASTPTTGAFSSAAATPPTGAPSTTGMAAGPSMAGPGMGQANFGNAPAPGAGGTTQGGAPQQPPGMGSQTPGQGAFSMPSGQSGTSGQAVPATPSSQQFAGGSPQGGGMSALQTSQALPAGTNTMLSQDEHVIDPTNVAAVGGGNLAVGGQRLQQFANGVQQQANS